MFRLKALAPRAPWRFYAVVRNDGETFLDDLPRLGANLQSNVQGLLALLDLAQTRETRPTQLPDNLCHLADRDEAIYEFRKGRLRLLWFYGQGRRVVICSHVLVKKQDELRSEDKQTAIDAKRAYLRAARDNALEVVE